MHPVRSRKSAGLIVEQQLTQACRPGLYRSHLRAARSLKPVGTFTAGLTADHSVSEPPGQGELASRRPPLFTAVSAAAIFSGATRRRPEVIRSLDSVQISHFVGSHCHGLTPLR